MPTSTAAAARLPNRKHSNDTHFRSAEVDDDLLQLLDQRASQQAQDRSAYVRDLLRRALEEEELNEFAVEFVHKVRRERREQKIIRPLA